MLKKFNSYLNRLYLPECSKIEIELIFNEICKLNASDLEQIKSVLAEIFCQSMIIATKQTFMSDIDIKLINQTFNYIKGLYNDKKNSETTYENVMSFLFQLQITRKSSDNIPAFELIADKLDEMNLIFLLKQNDNLLFPIGELLTLIFQRNLNFTALDDKTLNVFLLSMKIFKKEPDFKTQYKSLIERCNLKCLEYLENPEYEPLGETNIWKENLVKNGSLVLLNTTKGKVYIRSNNEKYFGNDIEIEKEFNSKKEVIGYYCEYNLPENCILTSVREIFENGNIQDIYNLLELIYDKKCYNIFLKKALYKSNNSITTTNKFVDKDSLIILDNIDNENNSEIKSNRDEVSNLLKKYSFIKLFFNENCFTDFLLSGAMFHILKFFSEQKVIDLINFLRTKKENFQSEAINYVLENNCNDETNLKFFSKYKDLTDYIKSPKTILTKNITDFIFLPYRFPTSFLENKVSKIIKQDCNNPRFIKPRIEFNYMTDEIISVTYDESNLKWVLIDKVDFDSELYCLLIDDIVYISNELDEIAIFQNKIDGENRDLLFYNCLKNINNSQINDIIKKMELHKDALCDLGKSYLTPDFETIAIIRLLHHCKCFNLFDIGNWNKFYLIMCNHNFIDFSYLASQEFQLDEGIFYIPKDKEELDATLNTISGHYIFNTPGKKTRTFYHNVIDKNKRKYFSRKQQIKQIVFLFDNIIDGSSTIKCLNAYLKLKAKDIAPYISIQEYFCDKKKVSIMQILKTNKIKFRIRAFYATKEGKDNIEKFISNNCSNYFEPNGISVDNYINTRPSSFFINNVYELYGKKFNDADYPVIREFNLPKVNIFPNSVTKQNNIATIFVRKTEVYEQ